MTKLSNTSKNSTQFRRTRNAAAAMSAVGEYFDNVDRKNGGDGLVWVKCIEPTGMQVALDLKDENGVSRPTKAIEQGAPRCLSSEGISIDGLRRSADIGRAVFVGNIKLMTTAEVDEWYQKIEAETGLDTSELDAQVQQSAKSFQNRQANSSQPDMSMMIQSAEDSLLAEENISSRVRYLMGEVDIRLKDSDRRPAKEITAELVNLQDVLSIDELEYIYSRGYWPSVRSWAKKKIDAFYLANQPALDEQV